jgi:hypothetical protein
VQLLPFCPLISYISSVKYKILLSLLLLFSINSFSKEKTGKTFLILFNETELKEAQSSPEYLGLSFVDKFHTRTYSGNSDAALLVTFPNSLITECEIGEMMVQVNPTTWIQLDEIAYRIIDLEENTDYYHSLVAQSSRRK